jgi:GNAT superfamily N-acetyltransferase
MPLRSAIPADASAIAALHVASWRSAYRGALRDEFLAGPIVADRDAVWAERFRSPPANQHVVVAEENGQIVGFACAYAGDHPEWGSLLDNLHVSRSLQRRGLGTALLRHVALWCAATAPRLGLYLWVLQSNRSAQKFYEDLGAVQVDTGTWSPPGGGQVPSYRLAWRTLDPLIAEPSSSSGLRPPL